MPEHRRLVVTEGSNLRGLVKEKRMESRAPMCGPGSEHVGCVACDPLYAYTSADGYADVDGSCVARDGATGYVFAAQ